MYPGNVPFPAIKSTGGSLGMNMAPPGRPVSANANQLIVLPFHNGSGYKPSIQMNVQATQAAESKYLKAGKLPPYLQPRRSRPVQSKTNRAISQGFVKPQSTKSV